VAECGRMDAMIEALTAHGRHPDLPEQYDLYGPLVGGWDIETRFFDESAGAWRTSVMTWTFGRILDGLGVQDVLRGKTGSGTTVRVYDSAAQVWRIGWYGPSSGEFATLVGRRDGATILQEGVGADGRPVRWCFHDVTAVGFRWSGEVSDDGGQSWRLEQEMRSHRRPEPPSR
jgi:hypothetical protein